MKCSAANFLPSIAVSICTSAKCARSLAIPITAAIISRLCAAWGTSSRIPGIKPKVPPPRQRKHEKLVPQDIPLLLDCAGALSGLGYYRNSHHAPVARDFQSAGAGTEVSQRSLAGLSIGRRGGGSKIFQNYPR